MNLQKSADWGGDRIQCEILFLRLYMLLRDYLKKNEHCMQEGILAQIAAGVCKSPPKVNLSDSKI